MALPAAEMSLKLPESSRVAKPRRFYLESALDLIQDALKRDETDFNLANCTFGFGLFLRILIG